MFVGCWEDTNLLAALALERGVPPPFIVAVLDRLLGKGAKDAGADPRVREARAKARQIRDQLVRPIFEASSREAYWEARDRLLASRDYVLQLLENFFRVVQDVPADLRPGRNDPGALEILEKHPPPHLAATAREYLLEGLQLERQLQRQFERIYRETRERLPEVRDAPSGSDAVQMLVSYELFSLWATLLALGDRPKDDEIAESIAKNFANAVAVYLGVLMAPGASDE
jgi:hypothetical protein